MKKVVDKKPTVVKIFVDMCHIEKLPHTKSRSSGSEDDSEPASNGDNEVCGLHVGLRYQLIFM